MAATEYTRRGMHVLPIDSGSKRPPRGVRWSAWRDRVPNDRQLRLWFDGDDRGIAIVAGHGGLAIRDYDEPAAYEEWRAGHGTLAEALPTVATGRGYHVYHRSAVGPMFGNCGDGEYRGTSGQYVVAPPTLHPETGRRYRWLVPLGDELPLLDPFAAGLLPEHAAKHEKKAEHIGIEEPRGSQSADLNSPSTPTHNGLGEMTFPSRLLPAVRAAIERTIPRTVGHRNAAILTFARELLAIDGLAGRKASELEPLAREWWGTALPSIATKAWDETWRDFCRAWGRAKHPANQGNIRLAFAEASAMRPPAAAAKYADNRMRRLVSLCLVLQERAGHEPFFLDRETVGRLFGVSGRTGSNWLRRLVDDGVLAVAVESRWRDRRATYYRFREEA